MSKLPLPPAFSLLGVLLLSPSSHAQDYSLMKSAGPWETEYKLPDVNEPVWNMELDLSPKPETHQQPPYVWSNYPELWSMREEKIEWGLDKLGNPKAGETGTRVNRWREALLFRGHEIGAAAHAGAPWDETDVEAIKQAQAMYGLNDDGIAGIHLGFALMAGGPERAEELIKWGIWVEDAKRLAKANGETRLIIVNLASYHLVLWDLIADRPVLSSRVIVGAPHSETPRIASRITDLKHHPDRSPTPSAQRKGKRYTPPGPNNPLGRMRFSMDNGLNIYLHDTNNRSVYQQSMRAQSMGCVRVEKWAELGAALRGTSLDDLLADQENRRSTWHEKIEKTPVLLAYSRVDQIGQWPVWMPDVYGVKKPLEVPLLAKLGWVDPQEGTALSAPSQVSSTP